MNMMMMMTMLLLLLFILFSPRKFIPLMTRKYHLHSTILYIKCTQKKLVEFCGDSNIKTFLQRIAKNPQFSKFESLSSQFPAIYFIVLPFTLAKFKRETFLLSIIVSCHLIMFCHVVIFVFNVIYMCILCVLL